MPRSSFSPQILMNLRCRSLPAANKTIMSVPPAKGFHSPCSLESSVRASCSWLGERSSYAPTSALTPGSLVPAESEKPSVQTHKSSHTRCIGTGTLQALHEPPFQKAEDFFSASQAPTSPFQEYKNRTVCHHAR